MSVSRDECLKNDRIYYYNMYIENVGELHTVPGLRRWLESDELAIPYLDGHKLHVVFDGIEDDATPEEFTSAILNFLKLTEEDRIKTNEYIFKNYLDFVEAVGGDAFDFTIEHKDVVWEHVRPTKVYVSRRPYGDRKVYVSIAAECDWEEEHGLQIVYAEGNTLKRIGPQDGHLTNSDAYGKSELEDVILR